MKTALLIDMKWCNKVLIVEDDADIRDLSREFLESEGYPVETCSNGEEAMAYLRSNPEPCLILLDMMMPIMNGKQFMHELTKDETPVSEFPVYLISASAESTESKEIGCRGYLKKPYDFNNLLEIVDSHCPGLRDPRFLDSRPE